MKRWSIGVLALTLSGGGGAVAQVIGDPCWCESIDGDADAGDLPPGAQPTDGTERSPLRCIRGQIEGQGLVGLDLEDMYLIRICDRAAFRAFTVPDMEVPPPDRLADPMLWLFSRPDELGRIANNDNRPDRAPPPPPQARITAFPDDAEPPIVSERLYYLAVSGFRRVPVSGGARIFLFESDFEISGADGKGGDGAIDGWFTAGSASVGEYRIELRGATYANASTDDCNENGKLDGCDIASGESEDANRDGIPDECQCPEDIDGDTVVDFTDLLMLLAAWGDCSPSPGACPEDIDGDTKVDFTDLLLLLAAWGPCVP